MNATYNMDYDVAALLLLLIEMVYVRIQYSHEKYSNRLFIMLLHSSFLLTIVDIASSLMLSDFAGMFPRTVVRIVTSLYFLSNAFVFLVFYRYIAEYLGVTREKTVGYYVRTYFPFVFIVECLGANHFANVLFSGGKYGHYSYGSLIFVIYLYPIYYFILIIVTLIRERKNVTSKQKFAVISCMAMIVISIAVQFFYSDVMSLAFGYSISMLILIMTLETPDYRRLIKSSETLEILRDELAQHDYFDRRFIEVMSHEICEPLLKIINRNDEYETENHDYIDGYGRQILADVNNVMGLINIVDDDETQIKQYSVRELIDGVCSIMMPAINESSVSLATDITSTIPDTLVGNAVLLRQCIINLVSDAIKYTKEGTISLSVGYRLLDQDNLNLIVTVEDTGVGMDRETVKKLLQINTKGRDFRRDDFTGYNFKVLITKKLVEQMNGKLSIDSAPGKGSVFTIIVPQEISDKQ